MENIAQAWNDITIESAEFVLEQAEKRVQASIDAAKLITDKALNVMQFSIPVSIALVGLVVTQRYSELLWFYMVTLAVSIVISYMSLHIYDLYDIEPIGYSPSDLLNDYSLLLEGKDQRLAFMFEVIVDVGKRIE
jgi:hypothetical protein